MDEEVSNSSDNLSDEDSDLYSSDSEDASDQNRSASSQNLDQTPGPSSAKRQRKYTSSKDLENRSTFSELEQICLLNALKDYGTGSSKAICSRIPTKKPNEIREYLERQRKKAVAMLKEGVSVDNAAPIDKWIQHLMKLCPDDEYKKQYIARAVKYIALFEQREEENEEDVNLRDCYLTLSSLISGDGPKVTDNISSYFMHSTIQDFVRELRSSNNVEDLKHLKKSSKPSVKCYGKKKVTSETLSIEHQSNNPLGIPEELLKFKPVPNSPQL